MEESDTPAQAACTDIDGTVVAYNTIFGFLRFEAAERLRLSEAEDFLGGLHAAARDGVHRVRDQCLLFPLVAGP